MPQICWLNGPAGTGKSAIAATLTEGRSNSKQPGASFFCSRDPKHPDLGDPKLIFPTLAATLACKYPSFRSSLAQSIKSCPCVASMSLNDQVEKLIVGPLTGSDISTVILIDALDQCGDGENASEILSALKLASSITNLKFFITSRPEPQVEHEFLRLDKLGCITKFSLHEVDSSQVNRDIRKFLEEKLRAVEHGWEVHTSDRLTSGELDLLCDRATGVFAKAQAIARFMYHEHHDPRNRLDHFLQSPEDAFKAFR